MPPVVVVGGTRGGTSAIAGIVHILGYNMGDTSGGYNEDPAMKKYPAPLPLDVIQARVQSGRRWGWKDPELLRRPLEVFDLLPEGTRFVVVSRSPEKAATSLMRYERYKSSDFLYHLDSALSYQQQVRDFLKLHPDAFDVGDFDTFRQNPDDVIERLADWLPGDKDQLARAKRYIAYNNYVDPQTVA